MRLYGLVAAFALLAVLSVGIFAQSSSPLPLPRQQTPPSTAPFDHVVTILMENHNFCSIYTGCGGTATYMSNLANGNTLVTNWGTHSHPSEGNYIDMLGGSDFGHTSDGYCCWGISAPNIVDRMETAGLTWQAFAEDASGSGTCSFTPPRNADHFGFKTFSDLNTAPRCSHLLTTSSSNDNEFIAAMNTASPSNYIWFTPIDNHNMHDNSVSSGDAWLAGLVPRILSSTEFTTTKAVLLITFDEAYTTSGCGSGTGGTGECVFTVFASNQPNGVVVAGQKLNPSGSPSHPSYLSMLEAAWGLPNLGQGDVGAPNMLAAFKTSSPPPPPSLGASFTYAPSTVSAGTPVGFTGSASGGTSPYTYSWNFGDGATGSGQTVTHSFASTGSHTTSLTVTDSAGLSGSSSQTVTVSAGSPPPSGPPTGQGGCTLCQLTSVLGMNLWLVVAGGLFMVMLIMMGLYIRVRGRLGEQRRLRRAHRLFVQ